MTSAGPCCDTDRVSSIEIRGQGGGISGSGVSMRKAALLVAGLVLLGWCGGQSSDDSTDTPQGTSGGTGLPALLDPSDAADAHDADSDQERTSSRRSRRVSGSEGASEAAPTKQTRRRTSPRYRVLDVVDGDTVKVAYRGSEISVRIIGIDTPETVHPSEPVECGGPQATAAATRLLTGKRVRLVFDPSQGRTDAYGRTLAYLDVPALGDFGLAMINRGKAAEYTYDTSYAHQARYLAAQSTAQAHKRGIWSKCGGVDTPLSQPARAPQPLVHQGNNSGGNCDPGYDPCVPPYPPDLNCSDVDGPIRVTGDDPHGFDADGDGIGCDS